MKDLGLCQNDDCSEKAVLETVEGERLCEDCAEESDSLFPAVCDFCEREIEVKYGSLVCLHYCSSEHEDADERSMRS